MHDSIQLQLPRHRGRHPLLMLLRGAWTFPTNLLGHLAGIMVSRTLGRRVSSAWATARVYVIRTPGFGWVGGVTLGHAILLAPQYTQGLRGRIVLAHELAHTRQHDVLGPIYLPLHILLQLSSALRFKLRPQQGSDPVHAYNVLEQRWLFLPHRHIRDLAFLSGHALQDLERTLDKLGA